jgi:hypothetical protein
MHQAPKGVAVFIASATCVNSVTARCRGMVLCECEAVLENGDGKLKRDVHVWYLVPSERVLGPGISSLGLDLAAITSYTLLEEETMWVVTEDDRYLNPKTWQCDPSASFIWRPVHFKSFIFPRRMRSRRCPCLDRNPRHVLENTMSFLCVNNDMVIP